MVLADSGSDTVLSAKRTALSLLETNAAKEAKNEFDCLGKPLDCSFFETHRGLQCGLKWRFGDAPGNRATAA